MSHAEEAKRLFETQERTRNFMHWIDYNNFLDAHGVSGETRRTEEPLDAENGKGFITTFTFADSSSWTTKHVYFTGDDGMIAFEKRG